MGKRRNWNEENGKTNEKKMGGRMRRCEERKDGKKEKMERRRWEEGEDGQ